MLKYESGKIKYSISGNLSVMKLTAFFLVIFALVGTGYYFKTKTVRSANYGWAQTTWQGGASTTAYGRHSSNQTGWNRYQSKSSLLSTSTDGQLSLSATSTFWTDTTDNNFASGTLSNSYISNGTVYIKKPNGVACTSGTECTAGYCVNSVCNNLAVGDTYQGGKVFYISGGHGLVVQTTNISNNALWGCDGINISGADSTTNGAQNTIDIVIGCLTTGIAARLCSDSTVGGYDDWYLPAKDQLNTLYSQKTAIGGMAYDIFWSSTEYSSSYAWYQLFSDGSQQYNCNRGACYPMSTRCIRNF